MRPALLISSTIARQMPCSIKSPFCFREKSKNTAISPFQSRQAKAKEKPAPTRGFCRIKRRLRCRVWASWVKADCFYPLNTAAKSALPPFSPICPWSVNCPSLKTVAVIATLVKRLALPVQFSAHSLPRTANAISTPKNAPVI